MSNEWRVINCNSETMANQILPESQKDILNKKLDEAKMMPLMNSVEVQVQVDMVPKAVQTDDIRIEKLEKTQVQVIS